MPVGSEGSLTKKAATGRRRKRQSVKIIMRELTGPEYFCFVFC